MVTGGYGVVMGGCGWLQLIMGGYWWLLGENEWLRNRDGFDWLRIVMGFGRFGVVSEWFSTFLV